MFEKVDTWFNRLSTATAPAIKALAGWSSDHQGMAEFIEPSLSTKEGDPTTASVIIIAAPGAVGKSSFARELSHQTGYLMVDLAETSPLGGNFFTGGVIKAVGNQALVDISNGALGFIVDSLDEAQLRAGATGFSAGLVDLAFLCSQEGALPAILFGRTLAAEEAWLELSEAGHSVALLEIDFFDESRARAYLISKLPVFASRQQAVEAAFVKYRRQFEELTIKAWESLLKLPGSHDAQFSGYAPVLDAICEYVLDEDSLNPSAKAQSLDGATHVELITHIATTILLREQKKLAAQLKLKLGQELSSADEASVYSSDEQLARLSASLLGTDSPQGHTLSDEKAQSTYREMVGLFAPQHPFLSDAGRPSNTVFSAYICSWALWKKRAGDTVRKSLSKKPILLSGLLFELYLDHVKNSSEPMSLSDVGLLHSALSSQLSAGQRVALGITESNDAANHVDVIFELVSGEESIQRWESLKATRSDPLELRAPVQYLVVDAGIMMELGNGRSLHLSGPVEVNVESLHIDASEVHVGTHPASPEAGVFLVAREADASRVHSVNVKGGADFSVSWPSANQFPWTKYETVIHYTDNEELAFMRRRLRRILTAFRSHSKGSMRRFADKMEHARMVKDARGQALLDSLLNDGILSLIKDSTFYVLNAEKMGQMLGVNYQALQKQQYTSKSDDYVMAVAARA